MRPEPLDHVVELDDHWWWRPGWRPGRHFYACHFTFRDQPAVQALVAACQEALKPIGGLDLIPPAWLHLTMQGIGFLDETTPEQAREVAALAVQSLRRTAPPTVTFHRPVVRAEAILLTADPPEPVIEVRDTVRQAAQRVLGRDLGGVPDYRPHVSIAYSNVRQPAARIVEALADLALVPATVTLAHVDLLEFHRDRRMYEWTSSTPIRIGESAA